MLTHLRIKNFKAWKDTGKVRLAPLTVFFGANSSGKSSIGHLLLALQQTAQSSDWTRALFLGDANSTINLGSFTDCLHQHDKEAKLEFELEWKLPEEMHLKDSFSDHAYSGDHLSLCVSMSCNNKEQPEIDSLSYRLRDDRHVSLNVSYGKNGKGNYELSSPDNSYVFETPNYRLVQTKPPEKFYRVSSASIANYQNAGIMVNLALEMEIVFDFFSYLGPLRRQPQRIYQWSGESPPSVGQRGEFTIAAILAATDGGRTISRGYRKKLSGFQEFIATWLKDLTVIHDFRVVPVAKGRKEYEVLVKVNKGDPEVKITDVGLGVSQVLPALVQPFYCPPGSTVWMEQPEIHLHPQVQAELADAFICATQAQENGKPRQVQLIIESHSEHFLNRLQRRIAEEVIRPEDVAIYFCDRVNGKAKLEELKIDSSGEISNWPENFFGDEMEDIAGRSLAAIEKRNRELK